MKMGEYFRKHKRGIIGTFIYHVLILLILIFLGFFTPLPLPGEEGIIVNFGDSNDGSGVREPSPVRNTPRPQQTVQQEQREEVPPPPPPSQPKTAQPKAAEEVALTQDYEETVAIKAAEKKREDEKKQKEQLEEARKQQQIDKELEAERIRRQQEIAERTRREEAARKAQEEEDRKINEITNRVQGAFSSNSASGTGGAGNNDGRSQGATFPGGNQGTPTGDPNAGSFGQGGSGSGNQGTGPSYSLSGRSARNLPRPNYPGDDEGVVVVNITVDKYGKVTAAEPGVRGTTIMNERFWNEAKQAALKANFNADDSAPAFQQGTITYRFVLD